MRIHPSVFQRIRRHRGLVVTPFIFALLFTLAACTLLKKSPSTSPTTDTLLDFLSYVPDTSENRAWVTFGDAAAWHTSWNVPRVKSLEEVNNLDDTSRAYWMGMMFSQTIPPDCLDVTHIITYDLRDEFAFNLFDMDRYLAAGKPPKLISILEHGLDRRIISDVLTKKGYAAEELDGGWTSYSLNDDNTGNKEAATFAEKLGLLNRILLSDQIMIIGRSTAVVESALDVHKENTPSLAENKDFIASVQALQDLSQKDTGELVGVIWMDGEEFQAGKVDIGSRTPDMVATLIEKYGLDTELPEFSLAAFATRHNGEEGFTSLILALVFPNGTDTEVAVGVLEGRLEKAYSLRMKQPFLDVLGATEHAVYAVEADSLPVVLATFRLDDPELVVIAEGMRPYTRVRSWMEFVSAKDYMFLYNP